MTTTAGPKRLCLFQRYLTLGVAACTRTRHWFPPPDAAALVTPDPVDF